MSAITYRLSRHFSTTEYAEEMPKLEENIKSPIALLLGVVPFAVAYAAMHAFKGLAYLTHKADKRINFDEHILPSLFLGGVRTITAITGLGSAAVLMGATKLFSLSQQLVWGHYVEKPSGDGPNTRLAQYGHGNQPWKDLGSIALAFCDPATAKETAWTLKEWYKIEI